MSQTGPLRVLVDAQLPKQLAQFLAYHPGYDSLHTLDLPAANATQDGFINRFSMEEKRVFITKDADFVNSFLLHGQPYKLLLVSTGNIKTIGLLGLFRQFLPQLTRVLTFYSYVELSRTLLTTHR